MDVRIYIDGYLCDLFDDETIQITQKVNDIESLSNVFSDYTNTFTLPATNQNNRIFKHYYNIDIDSFNANIRLDGLIEIMTLPFKFGQFQLEDCLVEDGVIKNYKVTFYSKNTQLTKAFGNDTLNNLNIGLSFPYTKVNLIKTINDVTYLNNDIITPLIAYTDRDWNYLTADLEDIASTDAPIKDNELRSALRVIKVIEAIESKYDIEFSRDFFGQTMFNKLYIWMNSILTTSSNLDVLLDSDTLDISITPSTTSPPISDVSVLNNTLIFTDNALNWPSVVKFKVRLIVYGLLKKDGSSILDSNITYYLYDNGILIGEVTKTIGSVTNPFGGSTATFLDLFIDQSQTPLTHNLTFKFSVNEDIKYSSTLVQLTLNEVSNITNLTVAGGSNLNVSVDYSLPNIKVIYFLQAIMKMFKLVIRPTSVRSFSLMTIDDFYAGGKIYDINKYVDTSAVTITRPEIYSTINFSYEKTDNAAGAKWRKLFGGSNETGYGDLYNKYDTVNNKDLSIKLPFENMLFERMTNAGASFSTTNILIGQSVKLNDDNTTVSKNDTKALLFFYNGLQSISDTPLKFKFSDQTIETLNSYKLVSNTDNISLSSVTTSLNWGSVIDPWHEVDLSYSLFNNYWKNWLETIYYMKKRKLKYECYLPTRLIRNLSLKDRLIIGSNRYKINDFTINLSTGKVSFNLFVDLYTLQQLPNQVSL